jgi:hypothetical protein
MQLKWRIEAITSDKIEPVFPADAREAGIKFRAIVAKIAAVDPVLGPDFIVRGKLVSFTSPKAPWQVSLLIGLDPADQHFLDNYVRVDAWWD